jgi:hypothetical protein
MNNLHRCTLRYPRSAGEAFRTPEWSTAVHGPYREGGGMSVSTLVAAVFCLWLVLVVWGVFA